MITLQGVLTTEGPLRIGTGLPDAATDRPVVRDQQGRPIVPATSLAGALRAACRRRYGQQVTDELFGPSTIDADHAAFRSPVDVHAAQFAGDVVPPVQLRQHVGIDRERLAAAHGLKFDEEVWPAGLPFRLRLGLEDDTNLPTLIGVLEEFAAPTGGLGAGPCPVTVGQLRAEGPADAASVVLAAGQRFGDATVPTPVGEPTEVPEARPSPTVGLAAVVIELTVETATPLACREPRDPFTSDFDNEPFTAVRWEGERFVRRPAIPGSSLLGVLRQRAERALSLAGRPGGDPFGPVEQLLGSPIADTFGTAGGADDDGGDRAGAIHVRDAAAMDLVWDLDGEVLAQPGCLRRPRVKLDRLTHSPLGSAFFEDVLVDAGTRFAVTISVAPPDRTATDDDVALIAVGLRDLAAGVVGIGGSSRSGYGTLRVVEGRVIEHRREDGKLTGVVSDLAPGPGELGWDEAWRDRLASAWGRLTDA